MDASRAIKQMLFGALIYRQDHSGAMCAGTQVYLYPALQHRQKSMLLVLSMGILIRPGGSK